jgi:hypothetical protein
MQELSSPKNYVTRKNYAIAKRKHTKLQANESTQQFIINKYNEANNKQSQHLIPKWITLWQVAAAHGQHIQSSIKFPSAHIPGIKCES